MSLLSTYWESFGLLVNSRVDDVLIKIAPDLNQPLFQFISAVVCGKHVNKWSSISHSQLNT